MNGLIEELNLEPDLVKIDAEGAALNILTKAENMTCRKIVVAAYHFPMEGVQVSMWLKELGFRTKIKKMQGSIYRSPFNPFVSIVLGWRDSR